MMSRLYLLVVYRLVSDIRTLHTHESIQWLFRIFTFAMKTAIFACWFWMRQFLFILTLVFLHPTDGIFSTFFLQTVPATSHTTMRSEALSPLKLATGPQVVLQGTYNMCWKRLTTDYMTHQSVSSLSSPFFCSEPQPAPFQNYASLHYCWCLTLCFTSASQTPSSYQSRIPLDRNFRHHYTQIADAIGVPCIHMLFSAAPCKRPPSDVSESQRFEITFSSIQSSFAMGLPIDLAFLQQSPLWSHCFLLIHEC